MALHKSKKKTVKKAFEVVPANFFLGNLCDFFGVLGLGKSLHGRNVMRPFQKNRKLDVSCALAFALYNLFWHPFRNSQRLEWHQAVICEALRQLPTAGFLVRYYCFPSVASNHENQLRFTSTPPFLVPLINLTTWRHMRITMGCLPTRLFFKLRYCLPKSDNVLPYHVE